jgi:Zn-dependent oligopeptidase
MDYKMSECFAALTGFRSFVEGMLATQRTQMGAEIAALKEELAQATAAAAAAETEVAALKGELQKDYKWSTDICKEIAFLSNQAKDVLWTVEGDGDAKAEVGALLTTICSIATFNSH